MTVVNPKSISGINSITTGSGSDNLLTIHTSDASSTERVRINSSGDVIVGSGITVSPDGDIFATGVCTATTFSGSGASLTNLPAANITGTLPAISGANLTNLDASDLASGTVPTARLGSGTASSSTFLRGDSTFAAVTSTTINSNTNNYVITGTGTANELQGESGLTYDGDNLNLSAGAHDSGMTITAANNNQETKLNIKGKASDGTVHTVSITAKRSANRGDIEVGGSARLTMTSDGKVGVNQTAPTSELQVGGGTNPMSAKPTLHVAPSSGNATMSLRGGSPSIYFDGTSGGHTRFLTDSTDIAISDGNLDSAGNERFRFLSGGGLCFNGDTTTANALDDYEEGTHTLSVNSNLSLNSSYNVAEYTKVGNLVTVTMLIFVSSVSGSNNVSISLPFQNKSGSGSSRCDAVGPVMQQGVNTGSAGIIAYIGNGSSTMSFYNLSTNGSWARVNNSDLNANDEMYVTISYRTAT